VRVLVTAANLPEREGGKQPLTRVKEMGVSIVRLNLIWQMAALMVLPS
jgi:putative transposase